jgi:FO synthase subunit 2 (EC 2.5.1.-)
MAYSLNDLLDDALAGHRLTEEEAVSLLSARGRDVWRIAAAADELRERKVGDMSPTSGTRTSTSPTSA